MGFALLAPLALVGLIVLGVPIYLHLIDRRRVPIVALPTFRFLNRARQRMRRHRRFRDRPLLWLRLAALLASIAAFARPEARYEVEVPAGEALSRSVVFLIDNSLSMGYEEGGETLLQRAKARVRQVLPRLPDNARIGLVVFNRDARDLLGGVQGDPRKVLEALNQIEGSFERTDLRTAVLTGVRTLLSTPDARGDLYLITDMTQAGLAEGGRFSLPEALAGRVRLIVSAVGESPKVNHAITGASLVREGGRGGRVYVEAEVQRFGRDSKDSAPEIPLDLLLNGDVVSRTFLDDRVGKETQRFSLPPDQDLTGIASLRLGPDRLPADDRYYFRVRDRRDLKVLIIDGEPGNYLRDAESFFVERALNPRKSSGSKVTPVVVGETGLRGVDIRSFSVVYLLNVAHPSSVKQWLIPFVERGGGLFIAVGDRVHPDVYNRELAELLPASVGPVKVASPDLTGEKPPSLSYPNVDHPLFSVFREAGADVFGTTAFYKIMPTAPVLKKDARVVMTYTNGLPALLSRRVGRGRVLFLTSTLDREWNDFPLKSVYLPFLQEATHLLAGNPMGEDDPRRFVVGDAVFFDPPAEGHRLIVISPQGERFVLEGSAQGSEARLVFRNTAVVGHYEVEEEGESRRPRPALGFSVNVFPGESDLSPLGVDALKRAFPGLPIVLEGAAREQGVVKVERSRVLTHYLQWGMLGFLALEGVVSMIRVRRAGGLG